MHTFTYSEARQHLPDVLNLARTEDVEIRRRDCTTFSVTSQVTSSTDPYSPLAVVDEIGADIQTDATTQDILEAVRTSRER